MNRGAVDGNIATTTIQRPSIDRERGGLSTVTATVLGRRTSGRSKRHSSNLLEKRGRLEAWRDQRAGSKTGSVTWVAENEVSGASDAMTKEVAQEATEGGRDKMEAIEDDYRTEYDRVEGVDRGLTVGVPEMMNKKSRETYVEGRGQNFGSAWGRGRFGADVFVLEGGREGAEMMPENSGEGRRCRMRKWERNGGRADGSQEGVIRRHRPMHARANNDAGKRGGNGAHRWGRVAKRRDNAAGRPR
ncbi:hypothetical protein DFH09DRAFT_1068528 [Mycena vulgaris]|nr:hypothetical protein DFH09DRAFT_1068528 [Mycena vulgaris]